MEQQTPLLSVSFLPTKQDYADYQIAACNAAAPPGERLFLRAAGFVLVVAGFVLCLLFGVGNPQNTVFFSLLVLLGLAVGFFHDSIQPLLVRSRAQSFYDHAGERMTAQSLSFFADHVDVKSDRYEASLPYAMLSVWGGRPHPPAAAGARRIAVCPQAGTLPGGCAEAPCAVPNRPANAEVKARPISRRSASCFLIKRSMGSP